MELRVRFVQSLGIEMRVDLRRGDVGMSEQILNYAEVGATKEQVRGERMPNRVWVYVVQSGATRVLLDDLPDRDTIEWAPVSRKEEPSLVLSLGLEQTRPEFAHVRVNGFDRGCSERDESLSPAFPDDVDDAEGLVNVVGRNRSDFRRAKTGGVHQFEHGRVAESQWAAICFHRSLDERSHLNHCQATRQPTPLGRALQGQCRIRINDALDEHEPEEHSNRCKVTRDRRRCHPASLVHVSNVLNQVRGGDRLGIRHAFVEQKLQQVVEIAFICFKGVGRQAALHTQISAKPASRSIKRV